MPVNWHVREQDWPVSGYDAGLDYVLPEQGKMHAFTSKAIEWNVLYYPKEEGTWHSSRSAQMFLPAIVSHKMYKKCGKKMYKPSFPLILGGYV